MVVMVTNSRFRGSMICGVPSMETSFQFGKFSFEVQMDLGLLVQNCTVVI